MTITGKSATTFGIVIFMAVFFVGSFQYSPKSQLLPLVISSIGLFMALVQLAADLFPAFERRFGVLRQRGLLGADQMVPAFVKAEAAQAPVSEPEETVDTEPKRPLEGNGLAFATVALMLVFALSLAVIPYYVAIPAFILIMLIILGRQNPLISALIALGVGGFMFILFDLVLNSRM